MSHWVKFYKNSTNLLASNAVAYIRLMGNPCFCFCYTAPQLYMQQEKCDNTLVYGPILTIN